VAAAGAGAPSSPPAIQSAAHGAFRHRRASPDDSVIRPDRMTTFLA